MKRGIDSRSGDTSSFRVPHNTEQLFIPSTYSAVETGVGADFSLQTVFSTLFRYRILIFIVSVITIFLAALFTRKIDPTYQAQAMVSVGQYIPPILGPTGHLLRETTSDRSYVADQLPLLKSYTIAEVVLKQDPAIAEYLKTAQLPVEILKNSSAAARAGHIDIESLADPDLLKRAQTEVENPEQQQAIVEQSEFNLDILKAYLELISYEHVRNTSMIAITAKSIHPLMAARIANTHSQAFISLVRAKLLDNARVNLEFLRQRKEEAREKAESVRKALLDYAEENQIMVNIGANGQAVDGANMYGQSSALATEYRDTTGQLSLVTRDRAQAESIYRSLQSGGSNAGRFYSGPQDRSIAIDLANARAEIKTLRKSGVSSSNPYMQNLQRQAKLLEELIAADKKSELRDHEIRLRALRDQERLMREEMKEIKERSVKESKTMVRYALLSQEDRSAQNFLQEITSRLEEVYIHLNSNQSHVRMIDEARAPKFSKARRDYLNLILGAVLGPFMGIALAFALDMLDNTVRTVNDLQRVLNVPLLGIIPRFSVELEEMIASNYQALPDLSSTASETNQPQDPMAGLGVADGNDGVSGSPSILVGGPSLAGAWSTDVRSQLEMPSDELILGEQPSPTMSQPRPTADQEVSKTVFGGLDTAIGKRPDDTSIDHTPGGTTLITSSSLVLVSAPHSVESEAFRNVRTCVTYGSSEKPPKLILVTSGQKHDGKTTVACNLAISLAQISERTLLIDADLRIPAIHKNFSLSRLTPGLGDYLRGYRDYNEVIFETPIPNLCLMLAGEPCPNPTELVGSKKMEELLQLLQDEFDHIIIDSPPVTRVADAMLLSRLVEGVVLVIRSGKTPEPVAENALQRLRQMDAQILGTVLNDVVAVPGYRDAEYYYLSEPYYGPSDPPPPASEEEGYGASA